MKLFAVPRNLWKRREEFIRSCQVYWNKIVRRITIDRQPVFIVGCGHSGTSLLLAVLGTHSRIFAIPYESSIAAQDDQQKFQKKLKNFDEMTILARKHRWVEKTPKHIRYIGRILQWRPDAKILIMIRDGRDVAFSIRERTGLPERGIRRWVEDNLAGKPYWTHPNVYLVKYEELISDFVSTVRHILEFLGEEYEEGLKDYYKIPRKWYSDEISKPPTPAGHNHEQYRNWQINQPLFDGRGRWKNMSENELSLIYDIGGELLSEFGYIRKDDPFAE